MSHINKNNNKNQVIVKLSIKLFTFYIKLLDGKKKMLG